MHSKFYLLISFLSVFVCFCASDSLASAAQQVVSAMELPMFLDVPDLPACLKRWDSSVGPYDEGMLLLRPLTIQRRQIYIVG
jgi:hypothetical protein